MAAAEFYRVSDWEGVRMEVILRLLLIDEGSVVLIILKYQARDVEINIDKNSICF